MTTPELFTPDLPLVPPSLSTLADLEVPLSRPRVTPEPLPVTPVTPVEQGAVGEPLNLDQVDSLAGAILDLNAQIETLTRQRDDLKASLMEAMQSANVETLTTARVKVTQVASARQVALLVRPEKLPELYQVVKSDDVAIRKAIDAGVDLSDYLRLKPATHYLKITPQHRR